jgi:hypothetical protein
MTRSSFALAYAMVRVGDGATIAQGWERRVRVGQPSPGRFAPMSLEEGFRSSLAARIVESADDLSVAGPITSFD